MDNTSSKSQGQSTIPSCPYCNSPEHVVRAGFRKTKSGQIQRFICRKCDKNFTPKTLPHASHSPKIIFSAISTYNLGHTLTDTTKIINRRFKTQISISTLSFWLARYKDICTFFPLRKKYQIDPKNIIFSKKFHHQQVYEFKFHKLKLNILGKQYPTLKSYLTNLPKELDSRIFKNSPRCSDFPFDLNFPKPKITKYTTNNATKIARFGQELAKTNRERHQAIEDFFLINDSATIAVEIPVYLTPKEAKSHGISIPKTLTGHIDILQVRSNRIHILDYKPEAERDKSASKQLALYALALGKRIKIPPEKMICAYFDETGYFKFRSF